ncbi:N-acetyltransferase [uncultured Cetobacterium sp.]|uniref:GNAT family N-acetyltransferase n=1 Tax=uncultured Cetobacterium sp. TaxID=527638 RepID=UPI002623E97C|nr:GNAT family N-acetyltransferase [uncultured Cetobacterium sp.]
MDFVEVKADNRELIDKIYSNELESFGVMGGADMWMLMSFVRYGQLYVLMNGDELLSVAQYQGVMSENAVFLYGFSTVPSQRGKGYGVELLIKTHEELIKKGIEKIYLTVDPNNIIAINMYQKMGYLVKELQKNEYGKDVDRFLMVKELV